MLTLNSLEEGGQMKKTFWMVTIVVLLIVVNVVLISTLVTKINGSGKPGQDYVNSTAPNQMIIPSVNNQIYVSDSVITIMAKTNLPDGTIVKYNLWHEDKYGVKSNTENKVVVNQGQLETQFEMDAKIVPQIMTLNTEVFFNTNEQPDQVKTVLGEKGEYLAGDAVKSLGGYNALLFQEVLSYPDEQTMIASMTPEDRIREAITESVDGLTGIEIYSRNERYAVEATYTLEDGFGLESAAEKVARDYTFAVYASGLPILRTSIIINKPDGIPGLIVTVGNNQASTQPVSTWTDFSIGPTIFINWVKENSNTDYKNIENHTSIKNNF